MRLLRGYAPGTVPLIVGLGLLAGLLAACSHQSVLHLDRQPWVLNATRSLEMNYLRFTYRCDRTSEGLEISGRAVPLHETIPDWASWTQDIWLGAYLSDKEGRVLAKQINILSPQPYAPDAGYSFQFLLRPQDMGGPGPVFITFGYRLVLSDRHPSEQGTASEDAQQPRIFFANESALNRL